MLIVLRKSRNIHITENITNHQEMRNRNKQQERVNQQQKNMNEQLRDRITAIETSATEKEREHTKERKELAAQKHKARRRWRVWVILALVAVGIGVMLAAIIGIAVAASQGNNIKANSDQIKSNSSKFAVSSEQIKSNSAKFAVNSEQIKSNSAKIAVNSQQTKSNLQLIEYLLSNAGYINKYIEARGKFLQGIEWIYNVGKTGTFYGPTFYLGQCKLRLKAVVINYYGTSKRASYYVERLKGEYDDTIVNCRITYSHISCWYLDATQPEDTDSYNSNTDLIVGGSRAIGYTYWRNTNRKVVVRVYFDTVGT